MQGLSQHTAKVQEQKRQIVSFQTDCTATRSTNSGRPKFVDRDRNAACLLANPPSGQQHSLEHSLVSCNKYITILQNDDSSFSEAPDTGIESSSEEGRYLDQQTTELSVGTERQTIE